MLRGAFRPVEFVLNVAPPNNDYNNRYNYTNKLFSMNVHSSRPEREGNLFACANTFVPTVFSYQLFSGEHQKCFTLKPSEVISATKIKYSTEGNLPEEWVRWMLDFDSEQAENKQSFKYLDTSPSWMDVAGRNITNTPPSVLVELESYMYTEFQQQGKWKINVLDNEWKCSSNGVDSPLVEKFKEWMRETDLLSLINPADNTQGSISSAHAAEGGLNVRSLLNSSYWHILSSIIDQQHLRGSRQTYIMRYGVDAQTMIHFNELVNKFGVKSELIKLF